MAGNWTQEEKQEIVKAFTVMATIQKNYGKEIDIKATLQAWEYILGEYPADKVLAAMNRYMRKSSDIPAPADLIAIIDPPKPKITQAEFIHAKEQHKLEGYPTHGYYGGIIRAYEAQEADERSPEPLTSLEGKKLIHEAMKRVK